MNLWVYFSACWCLGEWTYCDATGLTRLYVYFWLIYAAAMKQPGNTWDRVTTPIEYLSGFV